jgi:alpha-tubulin suppressor-like RCC1 family protein
MWGQQVQGSFGLNESGNVYKSSPTQVGSATDWSQVSVGPYGVIATKTNGTLWLWGYNNYGDLGFNNDVSKSSPTQLGTDTNWSIVSKGFNSSFAIKTTGALWAWGRNHKGQLGLNDTVTRSSPVQVGSATDWNNKIVTGSGTTIAIKTTGALWVWGEGAQGQLGNNVGYGNNRSSPVQLGSLTTWSKVSTGGFTVVATTQG